MKIQQVRFNTPKQNPSFKSVRVNSDDADLLIKIFRTAIDTKKIDASMTILQSDAVTIAKSKHWIDPAIKAFALQEEKNGFHLLSSEELEELKKFKEKAQRLLREENTLVLDPTKFLRPFMTKVNELGASDFLKSKIVTAKHISRVDLSELLAKVEKQPTDIAENKKLINEAFS